MAVGAALVTADWVVFVGRSHILVAVRILICAGGSFPADQVVRMVVMAIQVELAKGRAMAARPDTGREDIPVVLVEPCPRQL